MVTFTKRYETFTVGKVYCDGDCLSTDTKPTNGIANGSKLYEMDTGKRYMFDEENSTWLEVSNGGGGSSGSAGILVVNSSQSEASSPFVMNKTWQEIYDAIANGMIVINLFNFDEDDPSYSIIYNPYITTLGTDDSYYVSVYSFEDGIVTYTASSPNDYPVYVPEDNGD